MALSFRSMGHGRKGPGRLARSGRLAPLSAAAQMITTRDSAQNSPIAHGTAHRKRPSARSPDTRGIRFGQPEYSEETVKPCGPRHLGAPPSQREGTLDPPARVRQLRYWDALSEREHSLDDEPT